MAYNKVEKEVLNILEPICETQGVSIWDVEFKKEGPDYYLRVFLDKDEGIGIDDCERVSRSLDVILDEKDFIEPKYILEVSSAGLDRVIKYDFHFEKCMGKEVDVKLFAPIDGEKEFTAVLSGYDGNTVELMKEDKALSLPKDKISQIRLAVIF